MRVRCAGSLHATSLSDQMQWVGRLDQDEGRRFGVRAVVGPKRQRARPCEQRDPDNQQQQQPAHGAVANELAEERAGQSKEDHPVG